MKETAVVAGAASGIGRACLDLFARRKHRVIGLDINAEALAEIDKQSYAVQPELRCVDLVNHEPLSMSDLGVTFQPGEVISLIQCVGGSVPRDDGLPAMPELNWASFEQAYAFNVKPAIQMINACLPQMRAAGKGYIVTISSIAARQPLEGVPLSYSAVKSALLGLSRQLAADLAADHILVNTVCPGIISTPRITARWAARDQRMNQRILDRIPLGHPGSPEAVANTIYFLSTAENSYITGAILDVNGGMFEP